MSEVVSSTGHSPARRAIGLSLLAVLAVSIAILAAIYSFSGAESFGRTGPFAVEFMFIGTFIASLLIYENHWDQYVAEMQSLFMSGAHGRRREDWVKIYRLVGPTMCAVSIVQFGIASGEQYAQPDTYRDLFHYFLIPLWGISLAIGIYAIALSKQTFTQELRK